MKKILVTGGNGFIGSHTCFLLLKKGYEIVIIDSLVNSSIKCLDRILKICELKKIKNPKIDLIKGDLKEKTLIEKVFQKATSSNSRIIGVIHFAGLKSVSESIKNPLHYWDSNLSGTINLLKVMEENECKTIVFSSSATIYGKSLKNKISETSELAPINPYGNNKVAIETLLNDVYKSSPKNWKIINLRYFNPIGAHESGLIGECPAGVPGNIFPYILSVSAGKNSLLKIFGSDWPTHDGTGIRDYIHVMDLAEGHVLALEYLLSKSGQLLNLNLGTGIGTSVLQLINTFEETNNVKIPYEFTKRRSGDLAKVVADNTLATDTLKWTPKRTIKEMCKDGWKWQLLNPNGYY